MAETLGSLIDKLSITNNKIWHLEDTRNDRSLPDHERLRAADALTAVNKTRNQLVQEIDQLFAMSIAAGTAPVVPYVRVDPKNAPDE